MDNEELYFRQSRGREKVDEISAMTVMRRM